jgi:hypothetical protein
MNTAEIPQLTKELTPITEYCTRFHMHTFKEGDYVRSRSRNTIIRYKLKDDRYEGGYVVKGYGKGNNKYTPTSDTGKRVGVSRNQLLKQLKYTEELPFDEPDEEIEIVNEPSSPTSD